MKMIRMILNALLVVALCVSSSGVVLSSDDTIGVSRGEEEKVERRDKTRTKKQGTKTRKATDKKKKKKKNKQCKQCGVDKKKCDQCKKHACPKCKKGCTCKHDRSADLF